MNIEHINIFRVHCFNYYDKNKDKECPDLEVRYLIECTERIENLDLRDNAIGRRGDLQDPPIVCQQESAIPEHTTTGLMQTTETPSTDSSEDSGISTRTFHVNITYQIFVTFLKKLNPMEFGQKYGSNLLSRIWQNLTARPAVNISGSP